MPDFISLHIHSVEQLEILLLLHREPLRQWTSGEICSQIRSTAYSTDVRLRDLVRRGLISNGEGHYFFDPENAHRSDVDALAEEYATRRLRVIDSIFNRPRTKMLNFMDAFKITKGKDDG